MSFLGYVQIYILTEKKTTKKINVKAIKIKLNDYKNRLKSKVNCKGNQSARKEYYDISDMKMSNF